MPAIEAARRRVDEAARDAAERADQIRAQGATVRWFTSAVLGNDHAMAPGTVIGHEEYRRRPAGTRVRMSAAASTRCIRGSAPLSVPFQTGGAHAQRLVNLPVTRGRRPQGCSSTALTVHDRGGQRSNRPPPLPPGCRVVLTRTEPGPYGKPSFHHQ